MTTTDATRPGLTIQDAYNQASAHEQAGRLGEAEQLLERILATVPDQPESLHLKGVIAARRTRFADAASLIERAIAIAPKNGLFYRNICEVYRRLGRLDEAVAAGRRGCELSPNDANSFVNLAIIYYACCRMDEAIEACRRAVALAPDLAGAHFELAEALLAQGRFEEGWAEYEWRFGIAGAKQPLPKTDRPLWDGKPLSGTLLLVADQGFGDVIQFGRLVPWAHGICPDVVVGCSREMQPLLAQILPGVRMFDRWDRAPRFAAYATFSSLPRLYGVRADNVPASTPYLRAAAGGSAWHARLAALLPANYRRIGIVWAGRPTHNNDFNRSISLEQLAPLGMLENTALVSLQKGPAQTQIGRYFGRAPLLNLGPELTDYQDTMDVLANLDLLVTVDTSVAHLAGAMDQPAWVMVPFAPDWRWQLGRDDSPWYQSLRLFRQPAPGQWGPVVASIVEKLHIPRGAAEKPASPPQLSAAAAPTIATAPGPARSDTARRRK